MAVWIETPTCIMCGKVLAVTEYVECGPCADAADEAELEEFLQDRFDMETYDEWADRKEEEFAELSGLR